MALVKEAIAFLYLSLEAKAILFNGLLKILEFVF